MERKKTTRTWIVDADIHFIVGEILNHLGGQFEVEYEAPRTQTSFDMEQPQGKKRVIFKEKSCCKCK